MGLRSKANPANDIKLSGWIEQPVLVGIAGTSKATAECKLFALPRESPSPDQSNSCPRNAWDKALSGLLHCAEHNA